MNRFERMYYKGFPTSELKLAIANLKIELKRFEKKEKKSFQKSFIIHNKWRTKVNNTMHKLRIFEDILNNKGNE